MKFTAFRGNANEAFKQAEYTCGASGSPSIATPP